MNIEELATAKALLYGQPNDTFIAERDVLVKQIRAAGDRNLANEVKALRKPSAIAAEVNQIVRADPDGIELILEAAALLRAAQAGALDGSSFNASELQGQYRAAIRALAQSAPDKRAEVRAALEAATIDEASNEDLRTGCLVVVPTPVSIFGTAALQTNEPTTTTNDQPNEPSAIDELAERRAQRRSKTTKDEADKTSPAGAVEAELQRHKQAKETAAKEKAAKDAGETAAKEAAAKEAAAKEKAAKEKAAKAKAEKEHKRRLAELKHAHRDELRVHLAALDDEQVAAAALDHAQQVLAEADDERHSLEQQLAQVAERRRQASAEHSAAERAGADARERATAAEGAVEALAAAIDALSMTESA